MVLPSDLRRACRSRTKRPTNLPVRSATAAMSILISREGRLPDHRLLPDNVEPGELLALLNCGAYSLAQASQYNGRFLPPVVLTKADGTAELIRRRDTFEDLIASDL